MKLHVGTSGYSYKEWRGSFYPEKISAPEMLTFYAQHFDTVEINNTFYRMPSEKAVAAWEAQVPDNFRFVLKTSRRITHMKRLKAVEEEMQYLVRVVSTLGGKLGPMLVQLPPNFKKDLERLSAFIQSVPKNLQVAFEFRNTSWFDEDAYALLRGRNMALVATDGEKVSAPVVRTADWGYVRLRDSGYGEKQLDAWCTKLQTFDWKHLFVFFKHEEDGAGPELAMEFARLFERRKNEP